MYIVAILFPAAMAFGEVVEEALRAQQEADCHVLSVLSQNRAQSLLVPGWGRIDDGSKVDDDRAILVGRLAEALLAEKGYQVEQFVTLSGFGMIYVVRNERGERKVVKILRQAEGHEAAQVRQERMLQHEVNVANEMHLQNPHFISVKHKSIRSGSHQLSYLEMDLISSAADPAKPAPSLGQLMTDQPGYFTEKRKESIRWQLRNLLTQAHDAGIVHLDLKPSNVLIAIGEEGEPVVHLIDWGLSQSQISGRIPMDAPDVLYGTPGYMSPERSRGDKDFSAAEDVFALRYIEWHLRQIGNPSIQGKQSVRKIGGQGRSTSPVSLALVPNPATPIPSGGPSTIVHEDGLYRSDAKSDFGLYREPAIALDASGSEGERLVALAEWTRLPTTVSERNQLISAAQNKKPGVFLQDFGRRLMKKPTLIASEFLSSHVLIANLGSGLQLSNMELQSIRYRVKDFIAENEKVLKREQIPGRADVSPDLLVTEFIAAYNEVAKARGLAPF